MPSVVELGAGRLLLGDELPLAFCGHEAAQWPSWPQRRHVIDAVAAFALPFGSALPPDDGGKRMVLEPFPLDLDFPFPFPWPLS